MCSNAIRKLSTVKKLKNSFCKKAVFYFIAFIGKLAPSTGGKDYRPGSACQFVVHVSILIVEMLPVDQLFGLPAENTYSSGGPGCESPTVSKRIINVLDSLIKLA